MQILRESAISNKWLIVTLTFAVTLFFHFLTLSYPEMTVIHLLSKPGPVFFTIAAVALVNATLKNLIVLLGSPLDKNGYHEYQLIKEGNSFQIAYADVLTIAILVFGLSITLLGIFSALEWIL